jgi:TonB family protein
MNVTKRKAAFALTCSLFMTAPLSAQGKAPIENKDMRVVEFAELQYPAIGRTAEIQGIVVVQAKLDEQGRVADATALSGPRELIPDCLANVKKWRFAPTAGGTAVVVYNFRLTEGVFKNGPNQFVLYPPNFATITATLPQVQTSAGSAEGIHRGHPAGSRNP